MTIKVSHLPLACGLLFSGCSSVSLIPPAEVPVVAQAPASSSASSEWRPYRSGPLQAATPGISVGSGSRTAAAKLIAVTRKSLPSGGAAHPTEQTVEGIKRSSSDGGWQPYGGGSSGRTERGGGASVFGRGIESSWAKEYVPSSHHYEFGIFSSKAATDGQARMVMPTGEVYSASVVGRNGPCRSLEVTVTADGDLPIIARGSVEVCR
jgi:hypothetical protein